MSTQNLNTTLNSITDDMESASASNNNVSPLSNIIFFIILTLIYCIVSIMYLYTGTNIETLKNNSNNKIFLLIYISFLLSGNYILNLQTAKMMCPTNTISESYFIILIITIIPWLVIFVLLYLMLELFNGWVKPFSNTIGYTIIGLLGVKKVMQKLLNKKTGIEKERQNKTLANVFKYIENHSEKFINEFTPDLVDYGDFIRQLKKDDIFISDDTENNTDIIELYKLVTIKNIIGRIVWYILAGLLICSITYNYIIEIKCSTSKDASQIAIDAMYE